MTLREAAKLAGVAPSTLLLAIDRGEGPVGSFRLRGARRVFDFTPAAIRKWKRDREAAMPVRGTTYTGRSRE